MRNILMPSRGLSGGIGFGMQVGGGGGGGGPVTYATFDPATVSGSFGLTNNNLTLSHGSDWTHSYGYSTISKTSGKWYFEISAISGFGQLGIQGTGGKYAISPEGIKLQNEYGVSAYGTYWANAFATVPTVVGFMLDLDNNEIGFSINGTSYGVAFSITPGEYNLYIKDIFESSYIANFGATPFTYSVPSGYNAGLYNVSTLYSYLLNGDFSEATGQLPTGVSNGLVGWNNGWQHDGNSFNATFNSNGVIGIDTTELDFTVPFFIEAQVYVMPTGQNQVFVSNASHGGVGYNGYQLGFEAANGLANFTIGLNSWSVIGAKGALPFYQWVILRGEWTGTEVRLYIDGVLQQSTANTQPPTYVNTSVSIGAREYTPGSFIEYTTGEMQKVRFGTL